VEQAGELPATQNQPCGTPVSLRELWIRDLSLEGGAARKRHGLPRGADAGGGPFRCLQDCYGVRRWWLGPACMAVGWRLIEALRLRVHDLTSADTS